MKDYVNYETAKELKEVGFDEPCSAWYNYMKELKVIDDGAMASNSGSFRGMPDHCSTPTLWEAQKWLRERHGIAINVIAHDGGHYDYDIVFLPHASDELEWCDRSPFCYTYEGALSEGIEIALEIIKNNK